MYQPHIPLCYPVPYWFPIPDGEVYSDEHGEVSFDSVSNKARFRINKDGYKGIYVKTTGPAMKMRYLPGDEVVTRQYDDGTVTILLQRD